MSPQTTKLPPAFRKIRLELAREKGHPAGSSGYGYTGDRGRRYRNNGVVSRPPTPTIAIHEAPLIMGAPDPP